MPKINNYSDATDWLFQQFPSYQQIGSKAYKPTLDNTRKIVQLLDNPQDHLSIIHVAGSNGKGSVCSMLASIFKEAGYKTGLFTSPHIQDYRERIRVNGKCIDEQSVVDFVDSIQHASLDFEPSFFEMTFGLALQHFKEERCDICIIETGLGGRLDATNIVSPILSIITSISLEHTAILGDTLEQIAAEKAGIIKTSVPIVAGDKHHSVQQIFEKTASDKKTEVHSPSLEISRFELPMLGEHQKENFGLVLEALNHVDYEFAVDDVHIQEGLNNIGRNTGYRGRLQIIERSPTVIFDVSHNPEGIRSSIAGVQKQNKGDLHIVFGTSRDKDISGAIEQLPKNANMYFSEFKNERSVKRSELEQLAGQKNWGATQYFNDAQEALKTAKNKAKSEDTILAIGSFFLIADFF